MHRVPTHASGPFTSYQQQGQPRRTFAASPSLLPTTCVCCCSAVCTQTQLVRDMADEGELALAEEYRKQLGLPKSVLVVDPAAILAQEAARREQYMQLDLPEGGLLFVDSEAGLAQATQLLGGCEVLGLDVEWKPSHTAGVASPAAVLQVAICCRQTLTVCSVCLCHLPLARVQLSTSTCFHPACQLRCFTSRATSLWHFMCCFAV